MSGWGAVASAVGKYSWRTMFGIFVASGSILFFASKLGIEKWAQPLRGYLVAAFILSGAVLLTHLGSTIEAYVLRRGDGISLRMVPGSSLYAHWSVGTAPPNGKEPMMVLVCTMSFAHRQDESLILKRGYLKGTKEVLPMTEVVVDGAYDDETSLCMGVTPVKAKPGKPLVGRLVFVDQFNHKHVSDRITFRPNTIPADLRSNLLRTSPNCVFCNKPVEFAEQAAEAQMTAHTSCIWR